MIGMRWKTSFLCCLIALVNGKVISPFSEMRSNGDYREDNEVKLIEDRYYKGKLFQEVNSEFKREPRYSEAEWSTYNNREFNGGGTYAFGYDNVLDSFGNEHYRSEERLKNGTIVGEYGFTDNKSNSFVKVSYSADFRGYRAKTTIVPMEDLASKYVIDEN